MLERDPTIFWKRRDTLLSGWHHCDNWPHFPVLIPVKLYPIYSCIYSPIQSGWKHSWDSVLSWCDDGQDDVFASGAPITPAITLAAFSLEPQARLRNQTSKHVACATVCMNHLIGPTICQRNLSLKIHVDYRNIHLVKAPVDVWDRNSKLVW